MTKASRSHLIVTRMKIKKTRAIKARVNKDGLMGSKSRVHRVKKGRGSFRRKPKHDCE
jgi:stalled ribosome alternative rescue factor ArfA